MTRTSFARWPCSVARTLDLLGDGWTPLIVRDALYGATRYEEFQRGLGIARNILTKRLRLLVNEGLMEKRPYQDKPPRYDYLLTEKGRDFFSVIATLSRWGDRWLAGEAGPPIVAYHQECGHTGHAVVVCSHCGKPMTAENTSMRMGPGYPRRLAEHPEVKRRFAQ